MKKLLDRFTTISSILALSCALGAAPVLAQVPSVAPPPLQPSTFVATQVGLVAPTTGAGDLFCISGSATRLIKIKSIVITGIDATAQTAVLELVKRSAADSGGTPTTAATAVPLDTTQTVASASATLAAWTAIPTPGAAVGPVSARYIGFAAASTATLPIEPSVVSWRAQDLLEEVRLRGTDQNLCVNAPNAFTTAGPTLNIEVTWTEQ